MRRDESTIRAQLAATQLLAETPPEVLDELAGRVELRTLAAGDVLCREGEEGLGAFLTAAGRFRVERRGRDVATIGRGELVGEMSLLTGEPRVATVSALRDGAVLVLATATFDEVLSRHPECHRAITRQLVDRLSRAMTSIEGSGRASLITLLHDGSDPARSTLLRFVERLGADTPIVTDDDGDLATLEAANDLVVLAPTPSNAAARTWALARCDRALVFADATTGPSSVRELTVGPPVDLVLVHPPNLDCPSGTRRWLDSLPVVAHHHVRRADTGDLDRLVRRITDDENVLVLSGGGARGMAHVGLWASMVERDLPIDAVVGVSAGSVVGAAMAMGIDPAQGGRLAMELFADRRGPVDLTVPTVALASGTRVNGRLKELCGHDRRIEDLWLPLTIVSTNLTTADLHLHRAGRLWRAVRASTAIPGVFPPVPEPDGLLVDGGVVANLPIGVARQLHPGATVIASDVGKKMQLAPDGFPVEAEIGGWRALRHRLRRRGSPGMVSVLAQVTALGGAGANLDLADLHLAFDLDRFGMFDFRKAQAIIDAGRRQAGPEIEALARRRAGTDADTDTAA